MSEPLGSNMVLTDPSVLAAALDTVDALIIVLDTNGRILQFNRACERVSGYRFEEVRGRVFWDFLIPDGDLDGVRRLFAELAAGRITADGSSTGHVNEWVSREGGRVRVSWDNRPVIGPDGTVTHVIGTGLDVTRAHEAEVALRGTEAELARLVHTAHEGIWAIDTEGRTTFANERMAEMLGCTRERLMESTMWDFVPESLRPAASDNLAKRRQRVSEQHDFLLRRADGGELWTTMATSPIDDEHGQVVGALAMVTDITARKRSEQHLQQLVNELDHRVKNNMAAALALTDETLATASGVDEAREALVGRLRAMSVGQEVLSHGRWSEVDLERLVRMILRPWLSVHGARIRIAGPPVAVVPNAVVPLGLAVHELGANAVRHGALCGEGGSVELGWSARDREVVLEWREPGPSLQAPSRYGVGLDLVSDFVRRAMSGALDLAFGSTGFACTIRLPWQVARVGVTADGTAAVEPS